MMSYADVDECEPIEFYAEQKAKARKPHKCCDTGRIIQPGEMYWRIRLKFDGRVCSYSQSEAAYHFARWCSFGKENGKQRTVCIDFGGVAEYVADSDDDALNAEWARVLRGEITRTT